MHCVIESVRESRDTRIGETRWLNVFRRANSDISLFRLHPSRTIANLTSRPPCPVISHPSRAHV